MANSNIPMPSFMLVLTSEHRSHRRHPNTLTFDTLPSTPDHLMKTIGVCNGPEDHDGLACHTDVSTTSIIQEDADLPVIFEETKVSSSGNVAKETGRSIKANLLLFFHKLFKQRSALTKTFPA